MQLLVTEKMRRKKCRPTQYGKGPNADGCWLRFAGAAFNTSTGVASVSVATANVFAIMLHPGEMRRGTLSRHQKLQSQLVQDRVAATDERLIGEASRPWDRPISHNRHALPT